MKSEIKPKKKIRIKNSANPFADLQKNKIFLAQQEVESYFRNKDLSKTKVPNLLRGYFNQSEFPFPDIIVDFLIKKIKNRNLGYQPRKGPKYVRKMIAFYESIYFPANYNENDVILTHGALDAVERCINSFNDKNKEFIVPLPTYGDIIREVLTRGKLITLMAKETDGFIITADAIKKKITENTAAIILIQPGNPNSKYLQKNELEKIIELAKKRGIYVILDEVGDNFLLFDRIKHHPIKKIKGYPKKLNIMLKLQLPKNINSWNVIRINSFSKNLGLAALRYGYILSKDINIIRRLELFSKGNPTPLPNEAIHLFLFVKSFYKLYRNKLKTDVIVKIILKNAQTFLIKKDIKYLTKRRVKNTIYTLLKNENKIKEERNYVLRRLKSNNNILNVMEPDASYNILCRTNYSKGSMNLFKELWNKDLVYIYPGAAFGLPDKQSWIRITYANSHETNKKGLKNLFIFLEKNENII